jgi:hypothetical protein
MSEELLEEFIRPIVYASYPRTLAVLNITVLQVIVSNAFNIIWMLIALGSVTFIISAFCIFFFTLYPTRKIL